jgi:hypothetical protein
MPALVRSHIVREGVVVPGSGLDLAAPLRFNHAANLPFSVRGTGVTFEPATRFAHSSNEPVQALGTGIKLDQPLEREHPIDAVVRDPHVTSAGYRNSSAPNQWFGGPALSPVAGTMVLRDAAGHVVDSLNYGLLVDPWASEGFQAVSGTGQSGCRVRSPGSAGGFGPAATVITINRSAGRFPDGSDTDSNCSDFLLQAATVLPIGAALGATNLKVARVTDFAAGQTIMIGTGENRETAVIGSVGTGGATTLGAPVESGATAIPLAAPAAFAIGQTVSIGSEANYETAVVASITGGRAAVAVNVTEPLTRPHERGAQISGTGITVMNALSRAHPRGTQIAVDLPTPGAPNRYSNTSSNR